MKLASLRDPALVLGTIGAALGPRFRWEGDAGTLLSSLHDKRALRILDCCEHLIAATAAIAEDIVEFSPGIHLLATSREPLRAGGEDVYRLEPLPIPPRRPR